MEAADNSAKLCVGAPRLQMRHSNFWQIYSPLTEFHSGDDLGPLLSGSESRGRGGARRYLRGPNRIVTANKMRHDTVGGFADGMGTGYGAGGEGPKAAPVMLCAPGSHYLSVKPNKGEIIAVMR